MRFVWQVSLCCLLAAGVAMAQRGGGGGMRGGGGGFGGGGGMRGGGGGFGGGTVGGFRGGGFGSRGGFVYSGSLNRVGNLNGGIGRFGGFGFRNGIRDFDDRFGRGFYGGFGNWPYYFGYGYGPYSSFYWPSYASSYWPGYDYNPYDSGYASYQPSPNVTVVYPPQPAPPPPSAERARPVTREYDQYGQEIRAIGSPLYLIAFTDHTIRAATTYRVEGSSLHYTTPEREEKEAPLNTVDRGLSTRLNRERQVPFQLPPQ